MKVGPVAYRLRLPEELIDVHDMFYVSNLKKCLADPKLQVPLDEIQVDAKLNFVEKPVEILEKEFKKLKRSRITTVKVQWNSKRGHEFTWEHEDQMRLKNNNHLSVLKFHESMLLRCFLITSLRLRLVAMLVDSNRIPKVALMARSYLPSKAQSVSVAEIWLWEVGSWKAVGSCSLTMTNIFWLSQGIFSSHSFL
ncbi:hypothetical protein Tco_0680286 [Tanacetum coccineum]|uniref:Tf2-1-like SH3-like domain-containing protein n=1 Tax=Tanacetum coccineum TaxID=301880 RepID=A0ABQ4XKY6_9ASTR